MTSHDAGTVLAPLSPTPPPVALKSQLCVRDLQTHGFFVLVFSSFHCDTKKLRSLIKKNAYVVVLYTLVRGLLHSQSLPRAGGGPGVALGEQRRGPAFAALAASHALRDSIALKLCEDTGSPLLMLKEWGSFVSLTVGLVVEAGVESKGCPCSQSLASHLSTSQRPDPSLRHPARHCPSVD